MRNAVFYIVFVLLAVPLALRAADAPKPTPLLPATCANPTQTGNPATIKTFLDSATTDKQIKAFVTNVRSCPSACYDEKIVVSIVNSDAGRGVVYTVIAQDKCKDPTKLPKDQNPPRGCGLKEEPHLTTVTPEIAYDLSDGRHYVEQESKTIEESRCNANADSAISNSSNSSFAAGSPSLPKIDTTSSAPSAGQQSEQSKLVSQALQDNLGFSKTEADKAVQTNPNAASGILRAYDAGNAAEIKTRAQELGVTLNPDIQSKITNDLSPGSLSADVKQAVSSNLTPQERGDTTFAGTNTGTSVDTQKTLPGGKYSELLKQQEDQAGLSDKAPGVLAKFMKVESGGNCNAVSSTGPSGCFQYAEKTWNTWSAKVNDGVPLPLSLRNDPEVSAKVTANYIATNLDKYGNLIEQSGISPYAAAYAIHNIGDNGGPKFIRAYAEDSSQRVSDVLDSATIQHNPGIYGNGNITLAQAERNMLAKMDGSTSFAGGTVAARVGSAIGGPAYTYDYYNPPGYYGSVIGTANPLYSSSAGQSVYCTSSGCFLTNSSQYTGYSVNTSAPSSVPPAPIQQAPAPQAAPASSGVTQPTSVSTGGTGATTGSSVPTGTTGAAGVVPAPGAPAQVPAQAVMSLIVQPQKVSRGDMITASWSSLNMRVDVPCQLAMTSTTTISLARSNDGSTKVRAGVSGTLTFTLSCTAATGPVQKSVTVQVQ